MAKSNKKEQYSDYTRLISQKEREILAKQIQIDNNVTTNTVLKAQIVTLKAQIKDLKSR